MYSILFLTENKRKVTLYKQRQHFLRNLVGVQMRHLCLQLDGVAVARVQQHRYVHNRSNKAGDGDEGNDHNQLFIVIDDNQSE